MRIMSNNVFHISRWFNLRFVNMTIKTINIACMLKHKFMRVYEKWNFCVTGISYFRQDLTLQSFNAREAAYVHTRTHNVTRQNGEDFSSLPTFFPSAIRDRVTWFWNLSKEPAPWFLERRLRRKVYAKYLRIFRGSWYVFELHVTI